MREKINKITVSTRITIPLRDMLEQEAVEQGFSFCSYLEQLILERKKEVESNAMLDKIIRDEPSNNISSSEVIEEEILALKSQLKSLKQTYLDYQKRSIVQQRESEAELSDLETENYDLNEVVKELEDELALLQKYNFESESLPFLEKRYPDLSKATIIKTCLDCCAENEGHWLFLYRFSDYLKTDKSFAME